MKVLLAATGSVAAIKTSQLIQKLESNGFTVKLIATQSALQFLDDELEIPTHDSWTKIGDNILHIDLRNWADLFLIAPLSANSLAKISNGLCDNLVTLVARAWDFKKPFLCCLAMNTLMYTHVLTAKQVSILSDFGVIFLDPISKTLACGEIGIGAMAEVDDIVILVSTFRS